MLTNFCIKHERNKLFVRMENFWDLSIQLMKHGTNTSHVVFTFLFSIVTVEFPFPTTFISPLFTRRVCCGACGLGTGDSVVGWRRSGWHDVICTGKFIVCVWGRAPMSVCIHVCVHSLRWVWIWMSSSVVMCPILSLQSALPYPHHMSRWLLLLFHHRSHFSLGGRGTPPQDSPHTHC